MINTKYQTKKNCLKNSIINININTLNIKVLKVNSNSFLLRYDNFKNLNAIEHDNFMIYNFSYGLNLKDYSIS